MHNHLYCSPILLYDALQYHRISSRYRPNALHNGLWITIVPSLCSMQWTMDHRLWTKTKKLSPSTPPLMNSDCI